MGFMDFFKKREPYDLDFEPLVPLSNKETPKTQKQQPSTKKTVKTTTTPSQAPVQQPVTKPFDAPFTGFIFDDPTFYDSADDAHGPYQAKPWTPFTPKPLFEKRNIIILAIENTAKVNDYRDEVLRLVKKIIDDNKTSLFLFLRLGNNSKYFEVLDAEKLKVENLPECLLETNSSTSEEVNLVDALNHICEFSKSFDGFSNFLKYNNISYHIEDLRIIFIGTGSNNADNVQSSNLLEALRTSKNVKAIKYFCIKDEDAIQAASNGFPIIGHIESNFYK